MIGGSPTIAWKQARTFFNVDISPLLNILPACKKWTHALQSQSIAKQMLSLARFSISEIFECMQNAELWCLFQEKWSSISSLQITDKADKEGWLICEESVAAMKEFGHSEDIRRHELSMVRNILDWLDIFAVIKLMNELKSELNY